MSFKKLTMSYHHLISIHDNAVLNLLENYDKKIIYILLNNLHAIRKNMLFQLKHV